MCQTPDECRTSMVKDMKINYNIKNNVLTLQKGPRKVILREGSEFRWKVNTFCDGVEVKRYRYRHSQCRTLLFVTGEDIMISDRKIYLDSWNPNTNSWESKFDNIITYDDISKNFDEFARQFST